MKININGITRDMTPEEESEMQAEFSQEPTELEKLKQRIYNAEQIAADNSQAQQEMLELLLEIGVI